MVRNYIPPVERTVIGESRAVLVRPVLRRLGQSEVVCYEAWLSQTVDAASPVGRWVPLTELFAGEVSSLRMKLRAALEDALVIPAHPHREDLLEGPTWSVPERTEP
jgi:hypothetical protein